MLRFAVAFLLIALIDGFEGFRASDRSAKVAKVLSVLFLVLSVLSVSLDGIPYNQGSGFMHALTAHGKRQVKISRALRGSIEVAQVQTRLRPADPMARRNSSPEVGTDPRSQKDEPLRLRVLV